MNSVSSAPQPQPPIPEDQTTKKSPPPASNGRRNRILFKVFLLLLLLSALTYAYWYYYIRGTASTDDAYVGGNQVVVMPPQSGIVIGIYADDTDYVKQGQLLVKLDQTQFQVDFDKALSSLALTARQVKQLQDQVEQNQADLALQEARVKRAQDDYQRRAAISNPLAISRETLNHAQSDVEEAQASLNVSKQQLQASISALGSNDLRHHPSIENARQALLQAYVNLVRTEIRASTDGFVALRSAQLGEWVTPTTPLMNLIPLYSIWVDANFKETEIADIRIGQPAKVKSDIYGSSYIYHGKVAGIEPGTGSVFALIPPQNATGNWIKIVQRVPVRIVLDPEELKKNPLRLGLSVYVTVDTDRTEGLRLQDKPNQDFKLATPVYQIDYDKINRLMDEVVERNLNPQLNSPNVQSQ